MGVEMYLIREDNKTMYELGKGGWYGRLETFKTGNTKILENNDIEECLSEYDLTSRELVSLMLHEMFDEALTEDLVDEGYVNYILDGIMSFCDGRMVYLITDCHDLYIELKYEKDYKVAATRYWKE